jgi:DNA-binding IclR family transcriptional regulator
MRPTTRDTPSERLLRVLDAAADAARPLSVRELAARAELPRSTTHRLTGELVRWGGLERTPDGLTPGIRLFELGQRVPRQRALREIALPAMRDLHAATGRLIQLAILDHGETVCVDQVVPRNEPRVPSRPGSRMPAHATAMGKVLLAMTNTPPPHELPALTPHTITDSARLEHELQTIRERGYATNHEESQRGLHGVAVAIGPEAGIAVSVRDEAELGAALTALQAIAPAVRRALD